VSAHVVAGAAGNPPERFAILAFIELFPTRNAMVVFCADTPSRVCDIGSQTSYGIGRKILSPTVSGIPRKLDVSTFSVSPNTSLGAVTSAERVTDGTHGDPRISTRRQTRPISGEDHTNIKTLETTQGWAAGYYNWPNRLLLHFRHR